MFLSPAESQGSSAGLPTATLALTSTEKHKYQEYSALFSDQSDRTKQIKQLANDLIAFAGANFILNTIKESHDSDEIDCSKPSSSILVVLDDIDSEVIRLICDELYKRKQNASTLSLGFTPEAYLDIKINKKQLADLDYPDCPYLSNRSAAYLRNHSGKDGKFTITVCATGRNDTRDTLGNLLKVDIKPLQRAIIDNIFKFITNNQDANKHLLPYTLLDQNKHNQDPLNNILTVLDETEDLDIDIYDLSTYACTAWSYMYDYISNDKDCDPHQAMRLALGKSLYVLSLPSQEALFHPQTYVKAPVSKFRSLLKSVFKIQAPLRNCIDKNKEELNYDTLVKNYNNNFVQSSTAKGSKGVTSLEPHEHAIIKLYLKAIKDHSKNYIDAFNMLCTLEWDGKLSKIFDSSAKRNVKKDVCKMTEEFLQKNASAIDEDIQEISDLVNRAKTANSNEDRERLYQFMNSYSDLFNEKSNTPLLKEWNKLIYSKDSFEDSNFILALTKCILNACAANASSDSKSNTAYIELRLLDSYDKMREKNYVAASYFSLRFGAYLDKLQKELPFGFFVTDQENQLPDYAGNEEAYQKASGSLSTDNDISPVLNFAKFFEATKGEKSNPSKAISKEALTIKFELLHQSTSKEPSNKYKLTWTFDVEKTPLNMFTNLQELLQQDQETQNFILGKYRQQVYTITGEEAPLSLEQKASFNCYSSEEYADYAVTFAKNENEKTLGEQIEALIETSPNLAKQNANSGDVLTKLKHMADVYEDFKDNYFNALQALNDCKLTYCQALELANNYTLLQTAIIDTIVDSNANDQVKKNLKALLGNVLKIGLAYPDSENADSVIASPFTVEGMRSFTAKLERLTGLIFSAIRGDLRISQESMFLESLDKDIAFIDSPEICIPRVVKQPFMPMYVKEEIGGYALYEHLTEKYSDNNPVLPVKDYTDAVMSYIKRYIDTRPFRPEQFTVMLKECHFPEIAEGIYNALKEEDSLSDIRFQILFVNADVAMTTAINKRFEQLRMSDSNLADESEKRIRIFILSASTQDDLSGTYLKYLNSNLFEMNRTSLTRIADISIMFHVLDEASDIKYCTFKVPVVSDEINILPSIVNRNNANMNNTVSVGKFLVNQVQPLSRIQMFNSLGLCTTSDVDLKHLEDSTKKITDQANKRKNHETLDTVSFEAYLPYRIVLLDSLSNDDKKKEMIDITHDHSEVVAFIDELQCRRLITAEERRIVYYNKLKNTRLNLLVSSTAERHNTELHLRNLYRDHCLNQKDYTENFISATEVDAVDISGSMLLRAENRQKNTYELIGNVLCKYATEQIMAYLGSQMKLYACDAIPQPIFLSLDDYHMALAGKQGAHADILCLHIFRYEPYNANESTGEQDSESDKNKYLMIVDVIESKFLENFLPEAANKSINQTKESLKQIVKPFTGNYADRRQYLATFADMLADNCRAESTDANVEFADIQNLIREERIDIMFLGFSFVFVNGRQEEAPSDNDILTSALHESSTVNNMHLPCIQLRIQRNNIKDLFESYTNDRCLRDNTVPVSIESKIALLSSWLEKKDMSQLRGYLSDKRPTVINLRPSLDTASE